MAATPELERKRERIVISARSISASAEAARSKPTIGRNAKFFPLNCLATLTSSLNERLLSP